MSRRFIMLAAPAVALAFVAPATASAQTTVGSATMACGGNPFAVCATWTAVVNGGNLVFTITNNSNAGPALNPGSVFTQIALGGVSTNYSDALSLSSVVVNGTTVTDNWTTKNAANGLGLPNYAFGATTAQGVNGGLTVNQTAIFTFALSGNSTFTTDAFNNFQVAIHDQGGAGIGCNPSSTKARFNGKTGRDLTGSAATCVPPTTTVPEPSSMALLGTGLVGLVPMIRRRRK